MPTSVLLLIQDFSDKMGLPRPTALIGATDKSTRQYQSLLRETILDLSEYRWQQQSIRASFTSVATASQGALTTLFGAGYMSLIQDSVWNDTRHMRIYGPISEQVWNALQTLPNAGPEFQCWVSRNNFYISPTPVAGETISAIYTTKFNVLAVDGVTYKERVTVDSDTLVFPDNVVNKTFEYKWRKQKGEAGWENDYNDAIALIAKNIGNAGSTTLTLSQNQAYGPRPGIIIPPGNWGV